MTVVNRAGEQQLMPTDHQAFLHDLRGKLSGDSKHRWKQLAVLTLVGDGWKICDIAAALGNDRRHIYRLIRQARETLQEPAN